jgi:hypothetical protein
VASWPLHAPEAEQAVALVEFHNNVADCPLTMRVGLADNATVGVVCPAVVPTEVPALALVGTVAGPPHAINPAIAGTKSTGHLRLKYCMLPRAILIGSLFSANFQLRSNATQDPTDLPQDVAPHRE